MTGQSQMRSEQLPDDEMIARILAGEQRMFEPLMRKYNQRLYRIGMSVLENEAEAEDAMQATYISAYEHLSGFEKRSAFGTWLMRIMLNQCYQQKHKKKKFLSSFESSDNFIDMKTPANELANKELSSILQNAIEHLPEKYRLVFVMREMEHMSVRETATVLDIEEPNVKVRLNRAKGMLREHLSSYMQDHVYTFHLNRCDRIVSQVMQHLEIL